MSSGERKRMMAKPCACDTRQGLRVRCCGVFLLLVCRRVDSGMIVLAKGLEWPAVVRESRGVFYGFYAWRWVLFPSSAGLVESRVNLPRPLGKPEYLLVTDSGLVP